MIGEPREPTGQWSPGRSRKDPPVPLLERPGCRIACEVHGRGPALLLTHGYGASMRMWDPQIGTLGRTHRLILWDMRGHGESDSPEDPVAYSEAATVEDMSALLHACGEERAILGGLSLGGYMSLAFHLRYPEKVRALLLSDTGPGYRNDEARASWNVYAEGFARGFQEKGLASLRDSPEVKAATHRSVEGLIRAARGMLVQSDARVFESLAAIRVPTLVLVGAGDTPFRQATDVLAARIPGAEKIVVEGAGHAPNIDRPEVFNSAVRHFLARVEGTLGGVQTEALTPGVQSEELTLKETPEDEGTR